METTVTRRGQTVVPAAIRKQYGIQEGGRLIWLDDGATIRVVPIPADAVTALRGCGKGEGLSQRLYNDRREDRERA